MTPSIYREFASNVLRLLQTGPGPTFGNACKKRQMRWSRDGAQFLLNVRTAHLTGRLPRLAISRSSRLSSVLTATATLSKNADRLAIVYRAAR